MDSVKFECFLGAKGMPSQVCSEVELNPEMLQTIVIGFYDKAEVRRVSTCKRGFDLHEPLRGRVQGGTELVPDD